MLSKNQRFSHFRRAGRRVLSGLTLGLVFCIFLLLVVRGPAAIGLALASAQSEDSPTPDEIDNMGSPDGLPPMDDGTMPAVKKKRPAPKRVAKPTPRPTPKATPRPTPRPVIKKAAAISKQKISGDLPAADDEAMLGEPPPNRKLKARGGKPAVKAASSKATGKKAKKRPAKKVETDEADGADDAAESDDETESSVTEERDPVRISSNARELAIRVVGTSKISVLKSARKFVPKDFELRLGERIVQELASKTYFEPQALDVAFDMRTRAKDLSAAAKKANADGLFVFEIGLEQINGYLSSVSGRRIRTFEFKYKVGEMDEKNVVSIISERIIEGLVQAIPYRGFVTSVDKGTATVNLGSNHSVKAGDILELFEFRRPKFSATHKMLIDVQVRKVLGPSESEVAVLDSAPKGTRIEPFAKVSFSLSKNPAPVVAATDHSVVSGRWWFGFGGEIESFGAEAAAPKYESRVFKVNGAPFAYAAAGNDVITLHASFGSAKSDTETLGFFDLQGTYVLYQIGSAQSAWTIAAGGRVFQIQVTPNPQVLSALESTTIVSPVAEFKYQYVPRGRIRLVGTGEVFWPIYTNGASVGALPFAFGAGVGGGMQIALTAKFGIEVSGKVRYLRRPIDGQSGVQERQSILGAGLVFSF
ncbi:hypothetical protein BH10BDE1_BH10BDE1_24270 [soil metagenome]